MYQLSLIFLFSVVVQLSAALLNKCPDDTYVEKEFNGIRKCYKMYKADDIPHRCSLIDYCRPLHPDAIPTTINSIEEQEFIKAFVDADLVTLIGVYIPCPLPLNPKNFANVDGTPIPAPIEVINKGDDSFFAVIDHHRTDDLETPIHHGWYNRSVLCAITISSSPCPDSSYVYKEFNGVGKCYKNYTTLYPIDRCDLINVCRPLNPDAIPATIKSIEEREFIKTIVNPNVYTAIGVSIPCPLPYNVKNYKNVDGTPLPAPLEVTTGIWPDQYIGMLSNGKTDNLYPNDPMFHGDVLCEISIFFFCPPGTYPDSPDGIIRKDTNCVQYVPYVPGSTPEATCANLSSQYSYKPPPEIPCSLPKTIVHKKPAPMPYCPL